MSRLCVFDDTDPGRARLDTTDSAEIAHELGAAGVRFERWNAAAELGREASPAEVMAAYRGDIERLVRAHGYRSVDVVSMSPDHPEREAMRAKFLDEHTHSEDEVRFFVEGSGLFCLHVGARVYSVRCERGDLIGVPAGTRHWFDLGARPRFTAIRLFTSPEGWVASFTGSDCARRFPGHDERGPAGDGVVQAILTDIEGTTTSLSFVKDVLFPHARAHLPAWVRAHRGDARVDAALQAVRALEGDPSLGLEAVLAVLDRWMVADEKVTPLKTLQGFVWAEGYRSGELAGHVYEDAVRRLREWHAAGLRLFVFSSGSIEAQRLLFRHSTSGDLTPLFSGYFDTATGPKTEAASYAAIARLLGLAPGAVLFLSDSIAELDAARRAGMRTTRLDRSAASTRSTHAEARSFDDVRASPARERSAATRGSREPAGSFAAGHDDEGRARS